jgi:hypothetical protein
VSVPTPVERAGWSAAAVCVVAAGLLPTVVAGANGSRWLPPSSVPGTGGSIDVAMDAAGNAIAVWPGDHGVETAVRLIGAKTWRAQSVVSSGADRPIVEVDGRGTATVMWFEAGAAAGEWALKAATSAIGARFGSPELVATGRGNVSQFELAVGPRGDAVAVWQRRERDVDVTPQVEAAVRQAGGRFGPVQHLGQTRRETEPADAAVDARGNAIVVWRGLTTGFAPKRVAYARRGGLLRAETPPAGIDISLVAFDGAGTRLD